MTAPPPPFIVYNPAPYASAGRLTVVLPHGAISSVERRDVVNQIKWIDDQMEN